MPEVGEHRHAPPLQLGGLRVLVLVDQVLVEALGHQLASLRFHPGRDEGGEVQPRTAIEQQLVMDQLVGDIRRHRVLREAILRRREALAHCGVGLRHQRIGAPSRGVVRAGTTMQGHGRHYAGAGVASPASGVRFRSGVRSARVGGSTEKC